jgi:hypothetical protein
MILRLLRWWGARRPYFNIVSLDGSLYMGRWWLFGGSHPLRDDRLETGWKRNRLDAWIGQFVAGRLHHIAREDRARDYHTHPATFISIVIAGWYRERRPTSQEQDYELDQLCYFDVVRRPWSIAIRRAEDRHTIAEVSPGGAWTLVFWLRKRGSWGFATPSGFVNWRSYEVQP